MQVPCLIISIHASPTKEALVVDLDQLPLWPMAEVSKETGGWFTKMQNSEETIFRCRYTGFLYDTIAHVNLNVIHAHRQDNILFDSKLEPVLVTGENQVDLSLFTLTEEIILAAWYLCYSSWTALCVSAYVIMWLSDSGSIKTPSTYRGAKEKLCLSHFFPSSRLILN